MKKKIESPSVPKNEAITVAISTSGATIACEQDRQDDRDHEQRDRHDHAQVALGRLVEVLLHRAAGADERRRARRAGRAIASRIVSTRASAASE